jgi:hypothetical protein
MVLQRGVDAMSQELQESELSDKALNDELQKAMIGDRHEQVSQLETDLSTMQENDVEVAAKHQHAMPHLSRGAKALRSTWAEIQRDCRRGCVGSWRRACHKGRLALVIEHHEEVLAAIKMRDASSKKKKKVVESVTTLQGFLLGRSGRHMAQQYTATQHAVLLAAIEGQVPGGWKPAVG